MGLVLISLIFKLIVFVGLIFNSFSCSHKAKEQSDDVNLESTFKALDSDFKKMDVYPTLKKGGAFVDKSKEYGLENLKAVTFNVVDLNFDGFDDLIILPTYFSQPEFYFFDPKIKKFIKADYDLFKGIPIQASYVVVSDINRDRIPDMVVGVLNQKSEMSQIPVKLFWGKKVKDKLYFEQELSFDFPAAPTSAVSLIDFNLDGYLDFYFSNWYEFKNRQPFPVADRLVQNQKLKFIDMTSLLARETKKSETEIYPPEARPTFGASTCDLDENGFPDILTVSSSGYQNKLWMNLYDYKINSRYFEEIGKISQYASDPDGIIIPTGGGRSFISTCVDYNDDGIMDIFLGELSHAYDNESVDRSSVLTGSKTTYPPYFIRTEYLSDSESEKWNQGDRRATWIDYNFDGKVDLLVDNSGFPPFSRLVMFEQDETKAFVNVAHELGIDIVNPSATVILDINRDGKIDILTAQNSVRRAEIEPRVYLFENQLPYNGKKTIRVFLEGSKSNTSALGAMVMLYTEKGKQKIIQKRYVEYSQGGLPSQNAEGVFFGISKDTKAVGLKVRWPISTEKSLLPLEVLYPLKMLRDQNYLEVTLCENGKVHNGRRSCH